MIRQDGTINQELYFKTAQTLMNAVYDGLGDAGFGYNDNRNSLAAALRNNIYAFSLAKSFVQFEHYREMMIGPDGKILNKASIIKRIADDGEIFNKRYLEAEIDNAHYSAIMAHKWETLQSEYLQFSTVGDNKVRPEHAKFDKFTALKTDPIWRRLYPPLAFGCRCNVIPGRAKDAGKKMSAIEASKLIKPLVKDTAFDNNVGLSKIIYTDSHPYFVNASGKTTNLSFENYGLKSWDKIKAAGLDSFEPKTKEEYFNWWKAHVNSGQDDIVVKTVLGDQVLLPSHQGKSSKSFEYFKEHILRKNDEKRYQYATEAINILKNPDEIWNNTLDSNINVYLKFYDQGIIKMVVNEKMEAVSLYLIDEDHPEQKYKARKGTLLYRK